jgi:hypothetical protein
MRFTSLITMALSFALASAEVTGDDNVSAWAERLLPKTPIVSEVQGNRAPRTTAQTMSTVVSKATTSAPRRPIETGLSQSTAVKGGPGDRLVSASSLRVVFVHTDFGSSALATSSSARGVRVVEAKANRPRCSDWRFSLRVEEVSSAITLSRCEYDLADAYMYTV